MGGVGEPELARRTRARHVARGARAPHDEQAADLPVRSPRCGPALPAGQRRRPSRPDHRTSCSRRRSSDCSSVATSRRSRGSWRPTSIQPRLGPADARPPVNGAPARMARPRAASSSIVRLVPVPDRRPGVRVEARARGPRPAPRRAAGTSRCDGPRTCRASIRAEEAGDRRPPRAASCATAQRPRPRGAARCRRARSRVALCGGARGRGFSNAGAGMRRIERTRRLSRDSPADLPGCTGGRCRRPARTLVRGLRQAATPIDRVRRRSSGAPGGPVSPPRVRWRSRMRRLAVRPARARARRRRAAGARRRTPAAAAAARAPRRADGDARRPGPERCGSVVASLARVRLHSAHPSWDGLIGVGSLGLLPGSQPQPHRRRRDGRWTPRQRAPARPRAPGRIPPRPYSLAPGRP